MRGWITLLSMLGIGTAAAQPPATLRFQGPDRVTRNYQLREHPRVWFNAGNAAALADPTPGNPASHNAAYDNLMAQGLRYYLNTNHAVVSRRVSGEPAAMAALMGWMDDTATVPWDGTKTWLQYAKSELLGAANMYPFYFGGCDPIVDGCGSFNFDYGGEWGQFYAMAYTVLRAKGMLTTDERTQFANYFWNGMDGVDTGNYCELRWERGPGTIRMSGSNFILANGYSWHQNVVPGAWIQYRVTKDKDGAPVGAIYGGSWGDSLRVGTVNGNTITLMNADGTTQLTYDDHPNFQEGFYVVYKPWDSAKTCGMWNIFASHGEMQAPWRRFGNTQLMTSLPAHEWPNDPATPFIDTVEVNTPNWIPDPLHPIAGTPSPTNAWYVIISTTAGQEFAEVIGKSGTTLTLRRGKWGPTLAHPTFAEYANPYIGIQYSSSIARTGGTAMDCTKLQTGQCLQNLWITRFQGFLTLALAMADDDSRAARYAAEFADHYSKYIYPVGKEYFSIWNYSGVGNYGHARGAKYDIITWQLQNSIASPAVDFLAGNHIKDRVYQSIYWKDAWPPYAAQPSFGVDYMSNAGNCFNRQNAQGICWSPVYQVGLLYPNSDEAKYGWYTMKTKHNALNSTIFNTALYISGDLQRYPALLMLLGDYRSWEEKNTNTLPTSKLWITGDLGTGRGLHSFVSRTDWTDSATQLRGAYWDMVTDKVFAGPASYWISKSGRLIDIGYHGMYTIARGITQYDWTGPEIGPDWLASYPVPQLNTGFPKLNMRGTAKPEFMFVDTDVKDNLVNNVKIADFNALAGGRLRTMHVHLKTGKEYIIVMDDAQTTAPKRIRTRINYYNNGETHQWPENEGTNSYTTQVTEGNSGMNAAASYMDSSNGAAKLLTQWAVIGGSTPRVYDLNIRNNINTANQTRYDVGWDCSVTNPCRMRWEDGSVNSWTSSPGSFTIDSNTSGGNRYVWVRLDKSDGAVHVGYPSGVSVTCTGSIVCEGDQTDWPGGTYVRLFRPVTENGWPVSSYLDNCGYPYYGPAATALISPTGYSGVESGNCTTMGVSTAATAYGSVRSLYVDAGTTTEAQIIVVHRPTSDLGEVPNEEITVLPASGDGANHVVLQISGSDSAVVVLPKAGSSASRIAFRTTHSGKARLMVAGLAPGQYEIRQDGAVVGTSQVDVKENALYVAAVDAGQIEVARTGASSVRVGTSTLAPGMIGTLYETNMQAEGGTPPYNWLFWGGVLPPGLSLTIDGTLAGTPVTPGTYNLLVRVTDTSDPFQSADAAYELTIEDDPSRAVAVRAVLVSDRWAEVEYGGAELARGTACQLKLSYEPEFSGVVATYTDNGGASVRRADFGSGTPLAAGRKHYVKAECGARSGYGWFNTWPVVPAEGTVAVISSAPPAGLGATSMQVEYGSTPTMENSVTGACAGSCGVSVPVAAHSPFYLKRTYFNNLGQPVATSSRSAAGVR